MPKKKEHGAILAIDPSYRGLGVAFYNAHYGYSFTRRYDICQDYKGFTKYAIIVKLVRDFLTELFETLDEFIWDTTVLVIESQYKSALERLQDAIVNQFDCKLGGGKLKILPVAAYTWREYYSLSGPKYNQRKKLSVEFVNSNPQLISWAPGLKDDNICEAIILLNFALGKHSLALVTPMDYSGNYNDSPHICPSCSTPCVGRVSGAAAKNPGREYWACPNSKGGCPKPGFVCFIGEENKPPAYMLGKRQQRKEAALSKVYPAKRPYTQAPPPTPQRQMPQLTVAPTRPEPSGDNLYELLKKLAHDLQEFHGDILTELAEQTTLLKLIARNYNVSYSMDTPDYPEKRGVSDFFTEEQLSQHDEK